jgi:MFS family permease
MKVALKRELQIDNTKFALLNSCEEFVKSALIVFTGALTDRLGGAATLFYGNIIYSVGSILVAAAVEVKSFDFMIGASVIMSLGDLSTQVAQFQVFSSWFAPGNGFASTLGFEIMINKCGALAGTGSANQIAEVSTYF